MNQKPFIGAYWLGRKEIHQECVVRTLRFLKALSGEFGLTNWFIPGRTNKEASKPQELSIDAIAKRMMPVWKPCKGIPAPNSTDLLGFRFSVWNGNDKVSAGLSIRCGSYSPNQNQKNLVRMDFPKQPFPGDEASRKKFQRLLDIFVKVWDPNFALVTTSERKDLAFGDRIWQQEEGAWEECMTKSAWLLYRRG